MRAGLVSAALFMALASPALAKPPVVVEVYTSQGCGACADASRLVDELAGQDGLLPLTFAVDYWDYLGWRDTFARPEFTARQKTYAERWTSEGLSTPQVVVDGRGLARAGAAKDVDALIREARRAQHSSPDIRLAADRVSIGSGVRTRDAADVWLIRYDPRGQDVEVRRGENQGRTIVYRNVVKQLVRLGGWSGRPASFALPETSERGLVTLIMVQQPKGGEVLALQ